MTRLGTLMKTYLSAPEFNPVPLELTRHWYSNPLDFLDSKSGENEMIIEYRELITEPV